MREASPRDDHSIDFDREASPGGLLPGPATSRE
jgi:hypothetical protein